MADILLLGASGQVGRELARSLLPLGKVNAFSRSQCDLSNKDELINIVGKLKPEIIVNAAAYTAVDKAETEVDAAMRINAEAPGILAQEAGKLGALLVDYSTDYIFNGAKPDAYSENDEPDPINVYGRSKLAGLRAIEQSGCRHLVFRVSWVYGRHGNNFVKTMLRLASQKNELRVVADQWGSPTPADLIADITAQALMMIRRGLEVEGVFNLAPDGETCWHHYAQTIFEHLSRLKACKTPEVYPVESKDYPTSAQRPANSRLCTDKIKNLFGFSLPEWEIPLRRIIEEAV